MFKDDTAFQAKFIQLRHKHQYLPDFHCPVQHYLITACQAWPSENRDWTSDDTKKAQCAPGPEDSEEQLHNPITADPHTPWQFFGIYQAILSHRPFVNGRSQCL